VLKTYLLDSGGFGGGLRGAADFSLYLLQTLGARPPLLNDFKYLFLIIDNNFLILCSLFPLQTFLNSPLL
jgi:hypothetical protein